MTVSAEQKSLEESLYRRAREAWPDVEVDAEVFVSALRHHAAVVAEDEGRPLLAAMSQLRAEDLYLVEACLAHHSRALEILDRRYLIPLQPALARLQRSGVDQDEILQRLRQRLLISEEGRPAALCRYGGRGALHRWLRVSALREGLSLLRRSKAKRESPDDLLERAADALDPPDLAHLKRTYRREFKEAFEQAVHELTPRERTLLRYQLLDSFSIDQIGAVYGVHRATAARWLSRVRDLLHDRTRAILTSRIRVQGGELDSIMRLIGSHLDASIFRILQETQARDQAHTAEQSHDESS